MNDNFLKSKDIAIIAYGETKLERRSGKSPYELASQVAAELLGKTQLTPKDIDGFATTVPMSECTNPFYSNFCVDYLGLTPRWLQTTDLGGCSAAGSVARAAAAIKAGLCETVMLISADAPSTHMRQSYGGYRSEFFEPTGIQGPPGAFGLLMHRYMQKYELKFEALGKLAVAQRDGAVLNPNAYEKNRVPITVEDYLTARMVSSPLRLLDSVMYCDGANGLIITSTSRAKKMRANKMVHPVAYAEITNFDCANMTPDITESGFSVVGPEALRKAGLSPKDICMFHPYDDFLIAEMLQLEQIGFCARGEGSRFLLDTDVSYKGTLPINTGGGQISAGQPGLAGGGLNLVEGVRQLFGEAGQRQVKKTGNAMVTGIGVIPYGRNWGTSCVLILEA
ncbi:MAG: thiolase family protein [Betaproteobacteria bacterium]|nr:thiolase family protein [Betaproteobacteria bacterium]